MSYLTDEINKRIDSGEISISDVKTSIDEIEKKKDKKDSFRMRHSIGGVSCFPGDIGNWCVVDENGYKVIMPCTDGKQFWVDECYTVTLSGTSYLGGTYVKIERKQK